MVDPKMEFYQPGTIIIIKIVKLHGPWHPWIPHVKKTCQLYSEKKKKNATTHGQS